MKRISISILLTAAVLWTASPIEAAPGAVANRPATVTVALDWAATWWTSLHEWIDASAAEVMGSAASSSEDSPPPRQLDDTELGAPVPGEDADSGGQTEGYPTVDPVG